MNKKELNKLLLENVLVVNYIKKDGTLRRMTCTKSDLLLNSYVGNTILKFAPPTNHPSYNLDATDNIIVWDIEKKGWRTLIAHNVTSVDEIHNESKFLESLQQAVIA